MTDNPLKSSIKSSFTMNAAGAQKFARWAREAGDHEKAEAWAKYAAELAANERGN